MFEFGSPHGVAKKHMSSESKDSKERAKATKAKANSISTGNRVLQEQQGLRKVVFDSEPLYEPAIQ